MKKKSTSTSAPARRSLGEGGFFRPCVLLAFLLFAAAGSTIIAPLPATAGKLAFLRPDKPSQRTLTLEERVSYQKAIEEVYWRHRIWPKDRKNSKPSLDAVMSQAQIEKKVSDYIRNSQALEDYWHRPITAEQLQAEMDRMAKNTKQPEVLRELFEALGNDPFVIAECLARPVLAERLLTNWYAYDQTIHRELKQRAETELQGHLNVDQMKQLSGKYSEIEFIKSDHPGDEHEHGAEHGVRLNSREWNETVQGLAAMLGAATVEAGVSPASGHAGARSPATQATLGQIKTGKLSPLHEDEERFYATAVIEKTGDRLRLATVSWRKEPLESWRANAENQVRTTLEATTANYTLPIVSQGGCIDDTWTDISGPPDGREGHTAVWTGTEMIIWGGFIVEAFNTGGRYNPAIDHWTSTTLTNAPEVRFGHSAVWTGSEMIVWGGSFFDPIFGDQYLNTGGRYNPTTNSWLATSTTNAPEGRSAHTAVWTGDEMIVWGGASFGGSNSGGKYNPGTDSWIATSTTNAPSGRSGHTALWTGSAMIVWGGYSFEIGDYLNTGGRYDPNTDTWTATSITNAPESRENHTAVWTGSDMIVWGGSNDASTFNTGGRYDPITNSWTATTTVNAPAPRGYHTAIWTGSEMIVWGGFGNGTFFSNGGRYNPSTNSWTVTSTTNAPDSRYAHTAVWSGTEMIVWGGYYNDGNDHYLNTGGKYDPATDSWTATDTANAPIGRYSHKWVWTGTEMIVWGGRTRDFPYLNSGGKYNPSMDAWTATSLTNAPTPRVYHTAVWTGSEMIIWGGFAGSNMYLNTGGKYSPGSNTWAATSTINAPIGREGPAGVWTGSEMIVWGGYYYDGNDHYVNTGGKYNAGTDSWTTTNTVNAPVGREAHTAVWTGSEMITWGGYDGNSDVNTGGKYNPGTNSWVAMSTTNAPAARDSHRAVWASNEMIVWGGFNDVLGYTNTGGRYNPSTNSWTTTSTINAPSGRVGHSAIWTGDEMIVWGGLFFDGDYHFLNTGGKYEPGSNSWTATSTINAPSPRDLHAAVWTGNEMIIWGGLLLPNIGSVTGGRYCAQSGPTPSPTPCTGRCEPTPRPRATPHVRPTPR
jgi:N-acetylneuraminic acid mutarotase